MPDHEDHRTVSVRVLGPEDWTLYREIRLRALADAPEAFGSTWARESVFPEERWRERLSGPASRTFLAEDANGSGPLGLTTVLLDTAGLPGTSDADAELVSVWVSPTGRGRGVAGRLMERALRWAAERGAQEASLWVTEGNAAAERLYARSGFHRTGEVQPVRPGEPGMEFRMGRSLREVPLKKDGASEL